MSGEQLTIIVLRLFHILSGVFWVGSAIMVSRFLFPSIAALGPAGGKVMHEIGQVRKFPVYVNVAAMLTLLSGIGLYWRAISTAGPAWAHTHMGMTFSLGALLAICAAVVGNVVSRPAAKKMGMITEQVAASGGVPTPEQGAMLGELRDRLMKAGRVLMVLLVLATAMMAIARYM